MEKTIKIEFKKDSITGVAELKQNQIDGLSNSNSVSLRDDLLYFIPKQKAHGENVTVRGRKMVSPKVFAFGCEYNAETNTLTPVSVTTLSINGLRQRHYGFVKDGAVEAEAEQRDGVWRMKGSRPQTSVFAKGGVTINVEGKNAIIDPCCFRVTGRNACHTIGMTERDGKYDFNHFKKDGKEFISFQTTNLNQYEEQLGINPVSDPASICAEIKGFLA